MGWPRTPDSRLVPGTGPPRPGGVEDHPGAREGPADYTTLKTTNVEDRWRCTANRVGAVPFAQCLANRFSHIHSRSGDKSLTAKKVSTIEAGVHVVHGPQEAAPALLLYTSAGPVLLSSVLNNDHVVPSPCCTISLFCSLLWLFPFLQYKQTTSPAKAARLTNHR